MAEGFARKYGADVMEPFSAGFAPAPIVQPMTKEVMGAKNVSLDGQYPKTLDAVDISSFDLIVNMSGTKLPSRLPIQVRDWRVEDPIGKSEEIYTTVRDQIEMGVMRLILELRKQSPSRENASEERHRPSAKKKRGFER
jgi:arsenate reductase (thioredoxin)